LSVSGDVISVLNIVIIIIFPCSDIVGFVREMEGGL